MHKVEGMDYAVGLTKRVSLCLIEVACKEKRGKGEQVYSALLNLESPSLAPNRHSST